MTPTACTAGFGRRISLVLGMISLLSGATSALEGRFGTYIAEGPGAWLQVRHPILGVDFGAHLAVSTIALDVILYDGSTYTENPDGTRRYTTTYVPGTATATFLETGLVASRTVHRLANLEFALSSGLLFGILDATHDEGGRPLAREMLLVPAFLEADWHPLPNHPRLGVTLGLGGTWTSPMEEDNLYPEVSEWRWQARSGIVF